MNFLSGFNTGFINLEIDAAKLLSAKWSGTLTEKRWLIDILFKAFELHPATAVGALGPHVRFFEILVFYIDDEFFTTAKAFGRG